MLLSLCFSLLQEADFKIDFTAPKTPIPVGIGRGINDLSNASEGVWNAWAEAIEPAGGLARIWLDYSKGPMAKQTAAGLRANQAGLAVFLVVVGDPAHKAIGHEHVGKLPKSAKVWAEQVAQDVKKLIQAGVKLSHIEIWNEPNFAGQWQGSPQSFGEFFASAGVRLRELLPAEIKLGGPGMASASGAAYDWFGEIAKHSKNQGFAPDFLSWHFYSSYPGDIESCKFNQRIAETATQHGLKKPELILSEWNIDLPHPTVPECDDHRAAAFYVGVNTFLANTGASDSLFFFLQDGFWEAKEDYAGQSVGVYTLHGGPKAVLNGMRMFRKASELPACQVARTAPWNISCLATSDDDKAYILLSNSFGQGEKRARHFVDAAGVNLGDYRGKDTKLRAYMSGRMSWENLNAADADRAAWDQAKKLLAETRHETSLFHRPVRIEITGATAKPTRAWRIDANHSVPQASAQFRQQFKSVALEAPQRAVEKVLDELRAQELNQTELNLLTSILDKPSPAEMLAALNANQHQLGSELFHKVSALMRAELKQAQLDIPRTLTKHADAQLVEVGLAKTLRREKNQMVLDLPPWTVILVELDLSTE